MASSGVLWHSPHGKLDTNSLQGSTQFPARGGAGPGMVWPTVSGPRTSTFRQLPGAPSVAHTPDTGEASKCGPQRWWTGTAQANSTLRGFWFKGTMATLQCGALTPQRRASLAPGKGTCCIPPGPSGPLHPRDTRAPQDQPPPCKRVT